MRIEGVNFAKGLNAKSTLEVSRKSREEREIFAWRMNEKKVRKGLM